MALPDSYDEISLAEFMHEELGVTAKVLSWYPERASYREVINNVLVTLSLPDLSSGTIPVLRAVARREVWRAAVKGLTGFFNFSTDFQLFDLEKLQAHAQVALGMAEKECTDLGITNGGSSTFRTTTVPWKNDPYAYRPHSGTEI
jgi:hypothetical protein